MTPVELVQNALGRLLGGRDLPVRSDRKHSTFGAVDVSLRPGSRVKISPPFLEVQVDGSAVNRAEAREWLERQTFEGLRIVGLRADGTRSWTTATPSDDREREARWRLRSRELPALEGASLETTVLVAAAEGVDGVLHLAPGGVPPERPEELVEDRFQRRLVVRAGRERPSFIKVISGDGERPWGPGDGVYLAEHGRGDRPREVPVDDLRAMARPVVAGTERPMVLVTVPFLATGGAEHTLFESLRALTDRFYFAIVTLAPHRPELGDRRVDFLEITNRIYSLGDVVHPAPMFGVLEVLIDRLGASVLYNANGTTLFYELAARLKEGRPELRILDHLYDHRIGYIERYDPTLVRAVDLCIAENHRIARTLTRERDWPADRVSVIWPCGRRADAFPPPEDRGRIRERLREELGIPRERFVFLTAARMHPQKRPLDLVALAERLEGLDVELLVVGGGSLEHELDRAIAARPDLAIRRLPFRDDVPSLVVAADAGCLVSEYEGLPVFMMECIQAGRPFLGTDVGDLGSALRETRAGLVVDEPGDLDALERAARRMTDPSVYRELAGNAEAAAPRFDVERCAEQYAAAFLGRTA